MSAKKTQPNAKNPLETAAREVGSGLVNTVKKDVLEASGKALWAQILGLEANANGQTQSSVEISDTKAAVEGGEVEVFSLRAQNSTVSSEAHKPTEKPKAHIEAAINYTAEVARSSERVSKAEVQQIHRRVDEILAEIQKLLKSSKALEMEFAEVSVEETPEGVGTYHLNFFEWMLTVIRTAREKVEDSGAWLGAVKGKGGKKTDYWGMFKKHGTTFGMSNERMVATQTG